MQFEFLTIALLFAFCLVFLRLVLPSQLTFIAEDMK